jgi:hypothetical protein
MVPAWLVVLSLLTSMVATAKTAPPELAGVPCEIPPPLHCPEASCPGATITNPGNATEPKTGRKFFLDYPCDLKKNEKVTFILSLHGFGSYGNWQRNYFPVFDYKDKYRLVIATPTSGNQPPHAWISENDDAYLQNIVAMVYEQVGKQNIKAFWLAGHSQGGLTSNRLLRTEFFSSRVTGWLSLSGGRLGENPGRGDFSNLTPPGGAARGGRGTAPASGGVLSVPAGLPEATFSFIYETGRHEMDARGLPETSAWAAKLGCAARVELPDVIDSKAGYVYDSGRQNPGSDGWGRLPRPGTAQVFEYQKCKDGRIVADVVRQDKGHTEGLEPHVTEELVKLMLSAKKR